MLRFVTSAAALAGGLAALLPRARFGPARSPAPRCAAAVLALGLGVNGLGPCLCVPPPVKAADPHACCPRSADHHPGVPAASSIEASSASCCASHVTPSFRFTARIDDRDALRHAPIAAAATDVSTEGRVVASVIGPAAPSLRPSPPPRKTVLRI